MRVEEEGIRGFVTGPVVLPLDVDPGLEPLEELEEPLEELEEPEELEPELEEPELPERPPPLPPPLLGRQQTRAIRIKLVNCMKFVKDSKWEISSNVAACAIAWGIAPIAMTRKDILNSLNIIYLVYIWYSLMGGSFKQLNPLIYPGALG